MSMKRQDLLEDCVLELADRLDRVEDMIGLLVRAVADLVESVHEEEGAK